MQVVVEDRIDGFTFLHQDPLVPRRERLEAVLTPECPITALLDP